MKKKYRVLLCDKPDELRWIIREALKPHADIEVVGEVSGGEAVIAAAVQLLPDLVILDVSMPDGDGFQATREILNKAPAVRVLAYSAVSIWQTVDQMFTAGARGYVLKQGDPSELVRAIRTVLADGFFLSAGLMSSTAAVEQE